MDSDSFGKLEDGRLVWLASDGTFCVWKDGRWVDGSKDRSVGPLSGEALMEATRLSQSEMAALTFGTEDNSEKKT